MIKYLKKYVKNKKSNYVLQKGFQGIIFRRQMGQEPKRGIAEIISYHSSLHNKIFIS